MQSEDKDQIQIDFVKRKEIMDKLKLTPQQTKYITVNRGKQSISIFYEIMQKYFIPRGFVPKFIMVTKEEQ